MATIEQTNRAAAAAIDQLTIKVKAATESMKGLAALASSTGMKSMDSGFHLLGSTIGALLQPAFLFLSAGVMTVADLLFNDMKPKVGQLATAYAEFIPSIISATKAVYEFVNSFKKGGEWDLNIAGAIKEHDAIREAERGIDEQIMAGNRRRNVAAGIQSAEQWERDQLAAQGRPKTIEEMHRPPGIEAWDQANENAGMAPESEFDKIKKMFIENGRSIAADQKIAMGGGASFGGIGDAWKKMQVSSSQTNFQNKILERFDFGIRVVERALAIAQNIPVAVGP